MASTGIIAGTIITIGATAIIAGNIITTATGGVLRRLRKPSRSPEPSRKAAKFPYFVALRSLFHASQSCTINLTIP